MTRMPGTAPGAKYVRDMFARLAPRYDLLNHLLSFNWDRLWRQAAVRRFRDLLGRPGSRVLDLCCGTGDLALAFSSSSAGTVIGADFCHPMLQRARTKGCRLLVEADALALPFPDSSFDLVAVAFGFRNLADYGAGLREMCRLLRPGGWIAILEFSEPGGALFGPLYRFYFRRVLPRIGAAFSGDRAAYTYLPASVEAFPTPEELCRWMSEVGFQDIQFTRFTAGIACLHTASK